MPDFAGNTLNNARDLDQLSTDVKSYSDFVGASDPNDYYRFSLSSRSSINIKLNGMTQDGDMKLLDSRGTELAESVKASALDDNILTTLDTGTYYIRVYPYLSANTDYTLNIFRIPDLAGDTLGTALNINVEAGFSSYRDYMEPKDTDFYRFSLSRRRNVEFNLSGLSADADIKLWDESGRNELGSSTNSNTSDDRVQKTLNPGIYYVQIKSGSVSSGGTNYLLTASSTPDIAGELLADSKSIILNSSPSIYSDFVDGGDLDLYRFDLLSKSNVNIRVNGLSNDADLVLLDGSGNTLFTSRNSGTLDDVIDQALNAGTYYIKVYTANNSNVRYSLNASATTINKFSGQYFNNVSLMGLPVLVRSENEINFNWGLGGPGAGVNNDQFSVRWDGLFTFEQGTYLFRDRADDGIRLWVDGQLLIDQWKDQGATDFGVYREMTAGEHQIKVEYYDRGAEATAKVWWKKSTPWTANYFNKPKLPLDAQLTSTETIDTPTLNFSKNWGLGAPTSTPIDRFSARFSTNRWLPAGLYKIQTQADDGVKVTIGGQQVIDRWSEIGNFQNTGFFRSSGADVPIVVEYYDNEGAASLNFNITPVDKFQDRRNGLTNWDATVFTWDESKGSRPSVDFFNGDFSNPNVVGIIDLGSNIRSDGKPGFLADWGSGALNRDSGRLPNDYFAVRAYTTAQFDGGEYIFRAKADDGFQLFAKNQATGQWFYITPQASWEASSSIYKEYTYILPQGSYDLHFHFYEKTGNASFDLNWEKIKLDTVGNTLTTAKAIVLGQSVQSIQEFLYEQDTDDIYKFIVPVVTSASNNGSSHASMNFRINLTSDLPGLELSIIEDKDKNNIINEQNEVYQATNLGKTQQSIGRLLTGGTYYIRVHRASGSSTYNLSLDPVILSGTASNQSSVSGSTTGQVELWKHSVTDGARVAEGDEIQTNIETAIIIHGWNDNDINDRFRRLFTSFNGKSIQVFAVNWEILANESNNQDENYFNNSSAPKRPSNTSKWITSVAKVVAELVEKLKINNEKITLIGHSLGAYIASESANFLAMKGLQPQNLVLLDPAFPASTYDLDGNKSGIQISGSFDKMTQDSKLKISRNSVSYVVSDSHGLFASAAGDNLQAATAQDSFLVHFNDLVDTPRIATELHNAVMDILASMIRSNQVNSSYKPLSSKDYSRNRYGDSEIRGSTERHEGIIVSKKEGEIWKAIQFKYDAQNREEIINY